MRVSSDLFAALDQGRFRPGRSLLYNSKADGGCVRNSADDPGWGVVVLNSRTLFGCCDLGQW